MERAGSGKPAAKTLTSDLGLLKPETRHLKTVALGGASILQLAETIVKSPAIHELGMGSGFDDPAAVQNHNSIGISYGGQSMRNNDGGSIFHQFFQGLLDPLFGL